MKYVSITFICLITSILATAQQQLALQDGNAASLKNNYDILLSRNDSTAYALDRYYSFAAFLPTVNGVANVVWNSNNQELKFQNRTTGKDSLVTRSGVRTTNMNYSVNLSWTLFDG